MRRLFFATFMTVLLAACGIKAPIASGPGAAGVQTVANGVMPPPRKVDLFEPNQPYVVGPFDKLVIDVFGVEDLSEREVQADGSGHFSFPLVGDVDAGGKSPRELEQLIASGLRGRYVRNPQVTVNVKEAVSQIVTVEGQVKEPGMFPIVGRMTLVRAIARAKGLSDYGDANDVVIFRTVNGQRMVGIYNLAAIRRGNYPDPEVYANDVVIVGESARQRLLRDGLQLASAVVTPLVYILAR